MWFPTPVPSGVLLAQADLTEEAQQACADNVLCDYFLTLTERNWLASLLADMTRDILFVGAVFIVAWLAVRFVRKAIRRIVRDMVERGEERANGRRKRLALVSTQSLDPVRAAMRTETLGNVLRSLASMIIWVIAIFVALENLSTVQISLGPLIAGAGIVGVALGFGSQSLVKDFLSGIFMLMEDQYGVGDIIDVGEATGVVEGLTLRTTRLRDIEGVLWHVPNGEISRVGNLSQQWSRSLLDIPVAYSTDLNEAIGVIKRTADELWQDPAWHGLVLEEPDVWGVEEFADSAILIRLVIEVVPAQQWAVSRELRLRLKRAFDDAQIEIPFPQTAVWMRSSSEDDETGTARASAATAIDGERTRHRARSGEYDMARPAASEDARHVGGHDR